MMVTPVMSLGENQEEFVSSLRRSFYQADASVEQGDTTVYSHHSSLHAQRAQLLGHYSLPAVYSSFPLLPQSQTVLDVWQQPDEFSPALEQFITLFETLIQTPQPWYYAHATVPTEGRARAAGTLMRLVNTKRTADGRLQVLVQGLGKLRIINETRRDPFPRVDAQLVVDAEAIVREQAIVTENSVSGPGSASENELQRLCLSSALARERAWWAYDAAGFSDEEGVMPGMLVPFNLTVSLEATQAYAEEQSMLSLEEAREAWSDAGAQTAAADDEYSWDGVCPDYFLEIEAAESAELVAEQERCSYVAQLEQRPAALDAAIDELRRIGLTRAEELEVACWVELDALLQRYAALNAALPAEAQYEVPRLPKELLSLLPRELPPSLGPAARWPDGFNLLNMQALVAAGGEARMDASYSSWRRGTRLSFALAHVLAQIYADDMGEKSPLNDTLREPAHESASSILQDLLEVVSTSERLRLALRRMRAVRERLS